MFTTGFLFRQGGFGNAAKTSSDIFQIAEPVRPVRPKISASLTGSAGSPPSCVTNSETSTAKSQTCLAPEANNERHVSTTLKFPETRVEVLRQESYRTSLQVTGPPATSQLTPTSSPGHFPPSAPLVFVLITGRGGFS